VWIVEKRVYFNMKLHVVKRFEQVYVHWMGPGVQEWGPWLAYSPVGTIGALVGCGWYLVVSWGPWRSPNALWDPWCFMVPVVWDPKAPLKRVYGTK
jgi:hypothetical protein